ncbi:DNA mismatch repair protein MutL [termite gut metagenome]|uniref:DNA mismatch repair protein MutL n=1 Tax=termite gut metagenome TaxID=433724 RepID=A0A5J4SQ64_9ZZZZ
MSDIIRLLPDSVANQIAAGEVIQRPASVVKELMENAIDAEAKSIHVLVADAGKSCIQVIDDGKGMSETDARLAFERHATSKIREATDLFTLQTMGFRGEALASIAAVAQVELKTRQAMDELGTRIVIAGSKVENQETISCSKGSSFSVKNLFYNIPARRKFLKPDVTELNNIFIEFERIASVHPEMAFSLHHNGSKIFDLPPASLRQRITTVFRKKLNEQLLSIKVDTAMVNISGFIGKPEAARKRGVQQYFFVNGRYMRHPYFHKTVADAYDGIISTGEQVPYFIYFETDPCHIDVNIHPAKTEIKFENEQLIRQILSACVKESLGKFNAVPSIDFDTEGLPDIPAFRQTKSSAEPPKISYNENFNPFKTGEPIYSRPKTDWESLYDGVNKLPDTLTEHVDTTLYPNEPRIEKSTLLLQFKGRFILTSVKSGLMLIDQHRAHTRILFDKYMEQVRRKHGISQKTLFPSIIQLTTSEAVALENITEELTTLGFDLGNLGNNSYAINAIPSGTEGLNHIELIRNMICTAIEEGNDVKEEIQSLLVMNLARASAIVYGQALSNEEMINLVDTLFACQTPNYTPDGQTVLATIKEEEIEKLFK